MSVREILHDRWLWSEREDLKFANTAMSCIAFGTQNPESFLNHTNDRVLATANPTSDYCLSICQYDNMTPDKH